MEQSRRVTLGKIAGVFGIKGWLKIVSHTRPIDNILDYKHWWLGGETGGYRTAVVASRVQPNGIVVQLCNAAGVPIDDRDVAAALVGQDIAVERVEMPAAPAGQYYWADLIGLDVVSKDNEPLGRVTAMMENGAQDVLVLSDGEIERLIPFVREAIIVSVDLPAQKIVADWSPDY
jgi:16S rRNA processing protein RimM